MSSYKVRGSFWLVTEKKERSFVSQLAGMINLLSKQKLINVHNFSTYITASYSGEYKKTVELFFDSLPLPHRSNCFLLSIISIIYYWPDLIYITLLFHWWLLFNFNFIARLIDLDSASTISYWMIYNNESM